MQAKPRNRRSEGDSPYAKGYDPQPCAAHGFESSCCFSVPSSSTSRGPGRLAAIRERGGRVVVIDPRRTKTAAAADEHHFIRPGTDALALFAVVHTLFDEGLVNLGALESTVEGVDLVAAAARDFAPETVAATCGIPADTLRRLETMALMSDVELPLEALRDQVGSAVNLIVQVSRFNDGSRKVTHVTECLGYVRDRGYQLPYFGQRIQRLAK